MKPPVRVGLALLLAALAVAREGRPVAALPECLIVEDFSKAKLGEFPSGWKARQDGSEAVYSVREEGGRRFLHAVAKNIGIQVAKQYDAWDINTYPVLAWWWRPVEFPAGADERAQKTQDSALAVYAVFPLPRFSFVPLPNSLHPQSVKYVWSVGAPKDTHLAWRDTTQTHVLETGTARRGEWVEERVNVLADYKRFFGASKAPNPVGIAVLTDSDDTQTSAQGDYADFRVCRG
jgi:hypothetical protein